MARRSGVDCMVSETGSGGLFAVPGVGPEVARPPAMVLVVPLVVPVGPGAASLVGQAAYVFTDGHGLGNTLD
eukprot:scaffold656531_cov46-Prasinocladus_malaysianus.AAC.1